RRRTRERQGLYRCSHQEKQGHLNATGLAAPLPTGPPRQKGDHGYLQLQRWPYLLPGISVMDSRARSVYTEPPVLILQDAFFPRRAGVGSIRQHFRPSPLVRRLSCVPSPRTATRVIPAAARQCLACLINGPTSLHQSPAATSLTTDNETVA